MNAAALSDPETVKAFVALVELLANPHEHKKAVQELKALVEQSHAALTNAQNAQAKADAQVQEAARLMRAAEDVKARNERDLADIAVQTQATRRPRRGALQAPGRPRGKRAPLTGRVRRPREKNGRARAGGQGAPRPHRRARRDSSGARDRPFAARGRRRRGRGQIARSHEGNPLVHPRRRRHGRPLAQMGGG